ncbi:MAG: tRNA 2-thiouridine synthesizing protein A [Crocinitomicaceae bacterium]|jgi:tRNA 2-thiouridine synthesizing protein A
MKNIEFQLELDATGLMCPEPVMMLHGKVKTMETGQVLRVLATDPSTTRDIAKFCSFLNYELLHSDEIDGVFHYYLQKPK